MFKSKIVAFIFVAAVFVSGQAYCQLETQDQQVLTIAGTVTHVDAEGWVVNLQTDKGEMSFFLETESDLRRFDHHMASIEIEKGDPVTVQYVVSPTGQNNIIRLVDTKPL